MDRKNFVFIYAVIILLAVANTSFARVSAIDSLKLRLAKANDSTRVVILNQIGDKYYGQDNFETALSNYLNALKIAESIQNKQCIFLSLSSLTNFSEGLGKHQQALDYGLRALKIAEEQRNNDNIYNILDVVGGWSISIWVNTIRVSNVRKGC